MNRRILKIITYFKMTLLYTIAGIVILYFAGMPLITYVTSLGNMLIVKGAPVSAEAAQPTIAKLVLDLGTTDPSEIQVPELNTQYGKISCSRIALSAPVYYGDSDTSLLMGAGQYPNNRLPGQGKPILISGHDSTFFAPLEQIKIGDLIMITTDYGIFKYIVKDKKIAEASDDTAYDLEQDMEQVILYTCYPFGQLLGDRSKRFFVYCSRIKNNSTID